MVQVAANNDVTHTDIYIATKTGVTAVNTGAGGEVAGLIRFEDIDLLIADIMELN